MRLGLNSFNNNNINNRALASSPGLMSFKELVMTKADYKQLSKALGEPKKQLKRLGFSIMRVHDKPSTVDGKVWVIRSFTNEERVVDND